jgi:hypothetical protein
MVRRILVLSAVLLMVLTAGPAAWADNIAAAGDISQPIGGSRNDQATARLIAPSSGNGIGLVLALGDTQYECGEMQNYLGAYDRSWGQFKGITRPAPGHHEYLTSSPKGCLGQAPGPMSMLQPAGADYYQYFAGRTPPHPGYYSFNAEAWHFVVLNTVCTVVPGGCFGAMVDWLKADLAANKLGCTVVIGHGPYLSSAAPDYGTPNLSAIWPTLVLNDVDLFLAGHSHAYERLARVRTKGNVDEDWGPGDGDDGHAGVPIVIAGTGGYSLIPFGRIHPASRSRVAGKYGILKIVPNYPSLGRWVQAFKTTTGQTLDRVPMRCH